MVASIDRLYCVAARLARSCCIDWYKVALFTLNWVWWAFSLAHEVLLVYDHTHAQLTAPASNPHKFYPWNLIIHQFVKIFSLKGFPRTMVHWAKYIHIVYTFIRWCKPVNIPKNGGCTIICTKWKMVCKLHFNPMHMCRNWSCGYKRNKNGDFVKC